MPLEHFFEPKYSLTKALGVKRQNIHSYILTEICLTFHEVNYWNLSFAGMSDYPSVTIQQKQVTSMYPIHHSVLQYSSMETTISNILKSISISKASLGSVQFSKSIFIKNQNEGKSPWPYTTWHTRKIRFLIEFKFWAAISRENLIL